VKVFLTLFKDGRVLPDGFVTDTKPYVDYARRASDEVGGEVRARLALLCEAMQGLGYEVSFTSEPHSTEDPMPNGERDEAVPMYEEVS